MFWERVLSIFAQPCLRLCCQLSLASSELALSVEGCSGDSSPKTAPVPCTRRESVGEEDSQFAFISATYGTDHLRDLLLEKSLARCYSE